MGGWVGGSGSRWAHPAGWRRAGRRVNSRVPSPRPALDARLSLSKPPSQQVAEIEAAEKGKMREKCEKILAHGINCFVNRQLIYNYPEEIFAEAGGHTCSRARFGHLAREFVGGLHMHCHHATTVAPTRPSPC